MTGLIARAALVLCLGCTGWSEGYAARYNEGGMHRVAAVRGLPVADCMVSWDGAPLGTFVWVRSQGTGRTLACQITDMSAPVDRARHVRVNLIELDYSSSRAICVDYDGPWRACAVWVMRVIPERVGE